MRRTEINFRFRTRGTDQWGNKFLLCPICRMTFKEDGVMKHIVQSSTFNKKYLRFLNERKKPK